MSNPKWVIMVYIAADDTLANFAIESLKQLRDTATDDVVVVAQFDRDGLSTRHKVRRYIFDKTTQNKRLQHDDDELWEPAERRRVAMTDPATLTNFMNWAYKRYGEVENYCMILWGDAAYELLFELPVTTPAQSVGPQMSSKPARNYLTPTQLKKALQDTDIVKEKKLRIIGFDACSMSMCEIAYELRNQADFLVASQEEVPASSFRYNKLVKLFSKGSEPRNLCQDGVVGYVQSYEEYFYMHPVTLAAIDLGKMQYLQKPVQKLAEELVSAAADPERAKDIYSARTESQGYVGGLFVDLHDFCDNLAKAEGWKNLCENVSAAVRAAVFARAGVVDGHVKKAVDGQDNPKLPSHGLSIYFPYLKDEEKKFIDLQLVKGIPRLIDKGPEVMAAYSELNALSVKIRYQVHRQLIKVIEADYKNTEFANTGWYDFIQRGWSRILANQILANQKKLGNNDTIDAVYLAEQCVQNLLNVIQDDNEKIKGVAA